MTSMIRIRDISTDNAKRCEQLCNLAFNYGSNIVKVMEVAESNVGVIFENETYTFDRVECYIIDDVDLYQLELYHYNNERELLIVIPFNNLTGEESLNLNSLDLDNIVPKESFHLFYYDWKGESGPRTAQPGQPSQDSNICIFFSNKKYSLAADTSALDATMDVIGDEDQGRQIDLRLDSQPTIYYNSIGTRMNGVYSSADDIYIDCSPVGESEEEIIYSKKNDVLNDFTSTRETTSTIKRETTSTIKRYRKKILTAENKQMVYGILAGLFSIALFNRAFTKIIK